MLSPSFDCVLTVAGVFGWHRGEAAEVHSSDELSEHLEAIQDPLLPQARSPSAAVLIISSGSRAGGRAVTFGPTKLNSLSAKDTSALPASSKAVGVEVEEATD